MFELKYKITDADVKAVNKRIMLFYFALYLATSIIGIAIGVVAVVLRPQTLMLILGIILLVLGVILLACSILLAVAPKNFVTSAVAPSDEELDVKIDDDKIAVGDTVIPFAMVTKVKNQNVGIVLTVGKDTVLIVKNAIVSGQTFEALNAHLNAKQGKRDISELLNEQKSDVADNTARTESVENSEQTTEEPAVNVGEDAEPTVTTVDEQAQAPAETAEPEAPATELSEPDTVAVKTEEAQEETVATADEETPAEAEEKPVKKATAAKPKTAASGKPKTATASKAKSSSASASKAKTTSSASKAKTASSASKSKSSSTASKPKTSSATKKDAESDN